MTRLFSIMLAGLLAIGSGMSAAQAETPAVRKVAPVAKAKVVSGAQARMLNPQPLPPRNLSAYYLRLGGFNRVLLNPQPLPPRDSLLILRVLR